MPWPNSAGELSPFRFDIGDRAVVLTHPARPQVTVSARWSGDADTYQEPLYAVSGFVTRQRQSALAPEGYVPVPLEPLVGWRLAGHGGFERIAPGTIESRGGPGVLWYAQEPFGDVVVTIDWRTAALEDNSGVFVRVPPLGSGDPDRDWRPAVDSGVEIQIDERGCDHDRRVGGSARHATGAVYGRAAATSGASRGPGRWNTFQIEARGAHIAVRVNRVPVSTWVAAGGPAVGHVALQCHDARSRVAFRNLQIRRL